MIWPRNAIWRCAITNSALKLLPHLGHVNGRAGLRPLGIGHALGDGREVGLAEDSSGLDDRHSAEGVYLTII